LIVFAAEVRAVGGGELEQLQDDRGDAAEMCWAMFAFEYLAKRADVDGRGIALRVHGIGSRCEHEVATAAAQRGNIGDEVARIAGEILAGTELGWIHENGNDCEVAFGSRAID